MNQLKTTTEKYIKDLEERVELLEARLSNYDFFLLTDIKVTPDIEKIFNYFELLGNGEEKISFFTDNPTLDYIKSFGMFHMIRILEEELDMRIVIEHGNMINMNSIMKKEIGTSDSLRSRGKFNGFIELEIYGR